MKGTPCFHARAVWGVLCCLLLWPATPLRADDSEPAPTSKLAGVALPKGAERVTDASALKELTDPLRKAAAAGPNALTEGTQVQLTLTPQGPLLDGSAGRVRTWNLDVKDPGHHNTIYFNLKDIPIGAYTVTLRATGPDGKASTPTLVARNGFPDMLGDRFTPDDTHPIFIGPRWNDWPQGNASNANESIYVKRSTKSGATESTLEVAPL